MRQQPFEAVVAKYGPTVLRVCRAVLGPTAADDAWSETFLSAMRAYPSLRPDSNVEAWLVTIARRKAIDQLRAGSRRAISIDDLPETPSKDGVPGSWESDLWAALKAPAAQAARDRRLPLPRRPAARRRRQGSGRQPGRRQESGRRRHRHITKDLPERRSPMTATRKARTDDGDLFAALPEVNEEAQRRLHARLVVAATEAGILTSPTAPSTLPSARCCSPRPRRAWSG
jgi:RNA polymerase sigma factor (sigma-70 family)